MLKCSLANLFGIPRHGGQLLLLLVVAVYPVFNLPEQHFHEDSLRTSPTAEYPAPHHGEEHDKDHTGEHGYREDFKVLGPEWDAEEDELSLHHVE